MHPFMQRVLNFLRPAPRYLPLTVEDILTSSEGDDLVSNFNDLYYRSGVAGALQWRGVPIIKNPCDLWVLIEIIQEVRPRFIIETGTHYGGSARFYSDITKLLNIDCDIITVDINPKKEVISGCEKIHSLIGFSTDPQIIRKIKSIVSLSEQKDTAPILVLLDSDHSYENVRDEINLYSEFVTIGSYLVVEDTNVNGHPSFPEHGPGPFEAASDFLKSSAGSNFQADLTMQRHLLTFNPNGYLKRLCN